MSFEEGIERLKERHEALTQSVELLLISQRETANQIRANTENIGKLVEVSNRDAVDIAALARIAESHERRINGLEGERA
jgi:hypothetical protein